MITAYLSLCSALKAWQFFYIFIHRKPNFWRLLTRWEEYCTEFAHIILSWDLDPDSQNPVQINPYPNLNPGFEKIWINLQLPKISEKIYLKVQPYVQTLWNFKFFPHLGPFCPARIFPFCLCFLLVVISFFADAVLDSHISLCLGPDQGGDCASWGGRGAGCHCNRWGGSILLSNISWDW